jgi:hypothetical protein
MATEQLFERLVDDLALAVLCDAEDIGLRLFADLVADHSERLFFRDSGCECGYGLTVAVDVPAIHLLR